MGTCLSSNQNSPFFADSRSLWQDRQIRWDQPKTALITRSGETIMQSWEKVEDTKGENGLGSLTLSNLRIIWIAADNPKLNISIGLGNMAYIHFNMVDSANFGRVRASHLMTQSGTSRFEFTFACQKDIALKLFTELDNTLRYRATRVFRELVLRDEQLMSHGGESVVTYYGEELLEPGMDCENLTTDEKFPGVMFITNRRIIWNAQRTPLVNVSIPFIQIQAIGTRASSFGPALVVETSAATGGYVLGFRFPLSKVLSDIQMQLQKLHTELRANPYFGPVDGVVQYLDDRLVVLPEEPKEREDETELNNNLTSSNVIHSPMLLDTAAYCEAPLSANENDGSSAKLLFDNCFNANTHHWTKSKDEKSQKEQTVPALLPISPSCTEPFEESQHAASAATTVPESDEDHHMPITVQHERESTFSCAPSLLEALNPSLSDKSNTSISTNELNLPNDFTVPGVTERKTVADTTLLRRSVMSPTSKDPINLNNIDPLPIGIQSGHASVLYSSSSRAATSQAEMFLAMSPSSKKYRAPRCVVCMSTMTEVAFDPCGHLCSCMKCASKMKHCPICRGGVDKVLRVYLQTNSYKHSHH